MVLITENKDSALFFPPVDGGIVVEGSGDAAIRLVRIPWIRTCPTIVYWGDLDAHGFAILDRIRGTGIATRALLMDQATLDRYAPYASLTYADGNPLPMGSQAPTPFLSDDERRVLDRITDPSWDGPRRIEQERIPLDAAHDRLVETMSEHRSSSRRSSSHDGRRGPVSGQAQPPGTTAADVRRPPSAVRPGRWPALGRTVEDDPT